MYSVDVILFIIIILVKNDLNYLEYKIIFFLIFIINLYKCI